jgi:hypothetical protein
MAEFSWAYIDSTAILSASGPTGSIQYRVADSGGNTAVSGSSNFVYHTASSLLAVTGNVEISGTLTANQYNINVIDKTVTNISASGDTKFGDTADDTHQFTGSMFINGPLSASTNISASAFYGDGSTLTGISPAGSNTEVQFNNAGAFGASPRATITAGVSSAAVIVTGSVTVTGSALNTTTVIDGTHLSSSLNISGSSLYAEDGFFGNISVPRFVIHEGDADTYLDFTDDKLMVKVGGREFLTITEAGTDTFVINRLEGAVNTTINSDNGDILNASTAGITINDSGMPTHDFRVESNQKQNAIFLDSDNQYVHLLADDASPAGGLGADMALFVSGTIGSKNTAVRGTAVFGGDMVVSGSLYGANGNTTEIQFNNGGAFGSTAFATVSPTPQGALMVITGSVTVTGSALNTTTTIDGTHVSSSLNISGSSFYGDGTNLTGVVKAAAGTNNQIQFNNSGQFGASSRATIIAEPTSAAVIVTGSVTITGSALNTTTTIDGTHLSSSLNISGSAFYGSGANLTGVVKAASGATGQIQFNNGGAFGATQNATVMAGPSSAALVVTGSSTTVGSVEAISGSTQVFGVNSSATGLGGVRGRMVQHIRTGFSLDNGSTANAGRYISIGGNAVAVSATPSNVNCMITPFSGRLISIMYHMPSPSSKQDPSKGQPQWELRVGDVNELKGQTFANAFTTTGQITASSWPGNSVVGGVDIQTKVGSLHGNNITGSFSFGTGSVVALFFKSGDSTDNNFPGASTFTTVWEFDQLNPYITGSGN